MPRPSLFWDRLAKYYSRRPVDDEQSYRKKLQVTRQSLRPEMEILEFGCGTGSTAIVHAPYVKHIHAIDFSARMLEIAQARAEALGVRNITFQQLSVEKLEPSGPGFDIEYHWTPAEGRAVFIVARKIG